MITVTAPGHPVKAGAGYDCCCGECLSRRSTLLAALTDAIAWREDSGGGACQLCEADPAGLCEDHASDLEQAADYRALARELGADG